MEFYFCGFHVLKDDHLPKYYTNETLVIGISASGKFPKKIFLFFLKLTNVVSTSAPSVPASGKDVEKQSQESDSQNSMLKVPESSFPGS